MHLDWGSQTPILESIGVWRNYMQWQISLCGKDGGAGGLRTATDHSLRWSSFHPFTVVGPLLGMTTGEAARLPQMVAITYSVTGWYSIHISAILPSLMRTMSSPSNLIGFPVSLLVPQFIQ